MKKLLLTLALFIGACAEPAWQDTEIQVITEATLGIPPAPQMVREQVSVSDPSWSSATAPLLFKRQGAGDTKYTEYLCGYYNTSNVWVVDNKVMAYKSALVWGPCTASGTTAACGGITKTYYSCPASVGITTPLTYWETAPATGATGWGTTWGSGSTQYYKVDPGTWYPSQMTVFPQSNGQVQLGCSYGAAWPYLTLEVKP